MKTSLVMSLLGFKMAIFQQVAQYYYGKVVLYKFDIMITIMVAKNTQTIIEN